MANGNFSGSGVAGIPLDPLDAGVEALRPGVGDPEQNHVQHTPQMPADGLGRPCHGWQPAVLRQKIEV